jgi:hypothetical protein
MISERFVPTLRNERPVWMAPALQGLTRCFLRFGRVQSCVRPVDAVVQDRWP